MQSSGVEAIPRPNYDPKRDPRVGLWVVVVPSRWTIIMGSAVAPPSPPPEFRRRRGAAAGWFWYVHVDGGVVFDHDAPPAVFGGTDYESISCPHTGRTLFRHRWLPEKPPTDDASVLGLAEAPPDWAAILQRHWDNLIDALEEAAAQELDQQRQRDALRARGLDPLTGVGEWQPMIARKVLR